MKILFVTPYFPSYPYDNYGEVVLLLAKQIAKDKKIKSIEVLTPVFISRYEKRYYELKVYSPEETLSRTGRIIWLLGRFKKLMQKNKYDVINLQWVFPTGLVLFFLPKGIRSKIVVTARGSDIYLRYRNPFFKELLREILKKCHAAVSISSDLDKKIKALSNEKIKRFIIPSIGIDFSQFKNVDKKELSRLQKKLKSGSKKVILFIGGITRIKGADFLIKAINVLKNRYHFKDFLCVMIGPLEGELTGQLQEWISEYRLKEQVQFTGKLKYEELKYYYRSADVFVLPSRTEGLGAVLLEALYFKVPIIASATGGITDLIQDKKNGFLVPVGDHNRIASVLNDFFNGQLKLQNKNIVDIKKYNYKFMADKTIDVYEKIEP